MWRLAVASDDQAIVSMCLALSAEDPGPAGMRPDQIIRTLAKLREEPSRGRALVYDINSQQAGYALLISFWSNELGGEVCVIDEMFVSPGYRGRGLATDLIKGLADRGSLWPVRPAAIALEVTPTNVRARRLYE